MAPISVHFALGVLGAVAVPELARWRSKLTGTPCNTQDWRYAAWGMVGGAVLPDTDLILSSLASGVPLLFGGSINTEIGKSIHRTFTHSYVVCAVLLLIGVALMRRPAARNWGVFIASASVSDMLFHITPDLFYLVDVKCFWPIPIGGNILYGVHIGPFRVENLSTPANNFLNGLDFASETITWLVTWLLARRFGTMTRWIRILPWAALVNVALYYTLTARFMYTLSYDSFLVVVYLPGVLNLAISTILVPIAARETWKRLAGAATDGRDAAHGEPAGGNAIP
ncbi:MAG: metal-dependent hydrolase [Thermoplasmatota archaeon]